MVNVNIYGYYSPYTTLFDKQNLLAFTLLKSFTEKVSFNSFKTISWNKYMWDPHSSMQETKHRAGKVRLVMG